MATELDYYTILGVERSATDADIKKAFRKLAQQWHPDVNTDAGAAERFKEINEAYQVLSDPGRRQTYDMFGRAGLGGDGAGMGFDPSAFGSFTDIFEAFFGGAAAGGGGRGEIQTTRRTMLGQMLNVSACPVCRGEGRIVKEPCETCHGEGRTERRRTLRVSIPAGIDAGHQIRLSNEGEVGRRGGPAGSLYVAVHVAPHPVLRRDGTELFFEADVSIVQAALGTTIAVPTVDGDEDVEVKAGTQPGTEIRLRGRGVPHLRRTGSKGDLHVFVNVVVPARLS